MNMDVGVEMVTVDASNVDKERFFCYKSKPKTEGYRRKLEWLRQRFAEGMVIKIIYEGKRSVAFVEYIPGEYAWRAVEAPGYMVIHCLWVVGTGKKKGYATRLLQACIDDARATQMHGVAMVTSSGHWLTGKKVLLKSGFEEIDQAPPTFDLLVKRFEDAPMPHFAQNWEERLASYGPGITILRSDQCPYIEDATKIFLETAAERGIPARVVELETAKEVREVSPSPYGVFNVVYDGRLLSYHYLTNKGLIKVLDEHAQTIKRAGRAG
jgi:hypothetical protein